MKKSKRIISVLAAVAAACALTACITIGLTSKGPYSGVVTELEGGAPVSDVSVTDGRNVAKTDENGKFELKGWRKSRFVTITVPSGYKTDDFYIPVEKGKESYDFVLEKSELTAQENHCFVQISDTEIGEKGTGEWLDEVKNIIKENNPAFLIHTGDICYEAGLKRHIEDMNTETMGCTVRYIIGNHDYVDGKYGEELYESIYGPVWYSFDVGNVHYVVTPFQSGADYKSGYNKNDRWKWLKNDLENVDSDKKVVIFNHTKSPSDDYVISFGRDEIDLKQHNLIAWVFGHYHYNFVYENEGVLNISAPRPDCGGIDSSPAGTRVINIDESGRIITEMNYYDLNASAEPENTLWQAKLNGNVLFCDTVTDGNFVYTATIDDDYPRTCGIYCIDKQSGEIKWYYETHNSVKNNICIDGDRLVYMTADGQIGCIDKKTGCDIWDFASTSLFSTVGTSSGICIKDGIVYAGNPRGIEAVDVNNGTAVWSKVRNRGENSPAEFVVTGNKLLVNSHWDALASLDIANGKDLWDNKDEDLRFRSSTPVAVDDKTILAADDDAIMLINSGSGEIISKSVFEDYNFSSSAQPVIYGSIAYIPTANKGIIAYDIDAKKIVWNFRGEDAILFTAPYVGKGSSIIESTPVIDNGNLIFGSNDGYIYFVDMNTGELVKKYFAGSAVLGKVAVTEDKIFAGTFNGCVVCFDK